MFRVKATVTGYDKDEKKCPCHFRYKIGEEIIFDGETITGRICPSMAPHLGRIFNDLQASGGRHREGENPIGYYPFWHAALSVADPSGKISDGIGFRSTLERPEDNYKFIPDKTLYSTPPGGKYYIGKGTARREFSIVCDDAQVRVRFKVEAFDLSDKGDAVPYYRRTMAILDKITRQPGIPMDKILNEFSREYIYDIYPVLGQNMVAVLVGELELLDYVIVANNRITATDKGKKKLADFKATLTTEEKQALNL